MQNDNFDQFSYRRTWLLIRRDLLVHRNSAIIFSLFITLLFVVLNFFTVIFLYTTSDKTDLDTLNYDSQFDYFLSIVIFIAAVVFYHCDNKKNDNLDLEPSTEKMMLPVRVSEKTLAEFFVVIFIIPTIILLPAFLLNNLFSLFLGLPLIYIPWSPLLLGNTYASFLFFSLVLLEKIVKYLGYVFNIVIYSIIIILPFFINKYFKINGQNLHGSTTMALLTLIAVFWYAVYLARKRS